MIDLSDAGGACIGGKFDPISRGLKCEKQYAGEKERSSRSFSFLLCGIADLPCFSASGKVPVTRCGLPLRGTYAAYVPSGSHRREVRGVLLVPCGRCDLPPRIVGCNERTAYNNSP